MILNQMDESIELGFGNPTRHRFLKKETAFPTFL